MTRRAWLGGLALGLATGAAGLVIGYGIGARHWWPYAGLHRIEIAIDDLRRDLHRLAREEPRYVSRSARTAGGVTRHDPALAWPGYTFITAWRDGRFGASLVDMAGTTVHRWDIALSRVYDRQPPHLDHLPADAEVNIEGSQLLPGGDVLLNLYELGTVRLDRCSALEWTLARQTNHSIEPLPDGNYLIPSHGEPGTGVAPGGRIGPGERGWYKTEYVLTVDPDGRVVDAIDLLDTIHRSGFEGALVAGAGEYPDDRHRAATGDPLHLNDAEPLRPELAPAFPLFAAGDLLVSMSRISAIMVLDAGDRRVKWSLSGQWHGQFDPDFLPNGHILMVDTRMAGYAEVSRGEDRSRRSRLIEIDPVSQQIAWSWDGGDTEPFYTHSHGRVQLLPNGNVLTVDAQAGRVIEIARQRGDAIVWEYVNLTAPHEAGLVIDAARHPVTEVAFLDQPCPVPAVAAATPSAAR